MRGGRRRGPGGKKDSLKMCAISLWSLVSVNRVPAVLLFKVKYIHKLIKLPVMINVTEESDITAHQQLCQSMSLSHYDTANAKHSTTRTFCNIHSA